MTNQKKILFISYDGLTDPLGQSQMIPYLAGLTRFGYEFTILSCDKPERLKENKKHILKILEPYNIKWKSIPYHKNPPVLASIFDYYNLRNDASRLHKAESFHMIHTRPGLPTLVALWMKKKYGVKFLNDVRGFWADERVDAGTWNLKNPFYKKIYTFFIKHEFECIKKADEITCLTYHARKEIQSWNIFDPAKEVEVIPCSVDLTLFNPENINAGLKNNLGNELGIEKEDFVISYLGSIGGVYLTNEMMQFCQLINKKNLNIKFLFITHHKHDLIIQTAERMGIPLDKIILKHAQRNEVPALLSFSKYSIFFIKPGYSKISCSPTKHGEIMAMGVPVITNTGVGDVEDIITKYNSGLIVKELSEAGYIKVIEKIASGITFNSSAIREGAIEFYNLETAVQRYLGVYRKVLDD